MSVSWLKETSIQTISFHKQQNKEDLVPCHFLCTPLQLSQICTIKLQVCFKQGRGRLQGGEELPPSPSHRIIFTGSKGFLSGEWYLSGYNSKSKSLIKKRYKRDRAISNLRTSVSVSLHSARNSLPKWNHLKGKWKKLLRPNETFMEPSSCRFVLGYYQNCEHDYTIFFVAHSLFIHIAIQSSGNRAQCASPLETWRNISPRVQLVYSP